MTKGLGQFYKVVKDGNFNPPYKNSVHVLAMVAPNKMALVGLNRGAVGMRWATKLVTVKNPFALTDKEWNRVTAGCKFERVYLQNLKKEF